MNYPKGNSKEHLDFFINKINNNEPFAIVRPADGEFRILCDETLTNCDNWTYKQGDRLRNDMIGSLMKKLTNLYIGIPCDCCNVQMKNSYISAFSILNTNRTYANLFCNANWKRFISFLKTYPNGFSLVTSGTHKNDLPIKDIQIIDTYLVNSWNEKCDEETNRILSWISTKKNELICFSAGPLSKVWIPIAFELFPTNTYLDVGSTLDIFTKGVTNRYYTKDNDELTNLVCCFKD